MKIALLIHSLEAGGAERNIVWLASQFALCENSVDLITFSSASSFFPLPPSVQHLPLGHSTKGKKGIRALLALRTLSNSLEELLHKCTPDLIISFMDQANLIALHAARTTQIPVIVSERINPAKSSLMEKSLPLRLAFTYLRKKWYRRAHKVVVQTKGAAEMFSEQGLTNTVIIPNAVRTPPLEDTLPSPFPFPYLLCMGRLVPQKRFDRAIDLLAQLTPQFPDMHLVIAGKGILESALTSRAESHGILNRVHFIGETTTPYHLMRHATLFLLTSDYEGFPGVLAEAMSVGCCVVSTHCPFGPSELIRTGENGVLVACDKEDTLLSAVKELLSNPQRMTSMGNRAKDIIDYFSEDAVMKRWMNLATDAAQANRR